MGIVIDLSEATFIDSSIIGVTFEHAFDHEHSRARDDVVLVAPPGRPPRRVLDLVAADWFVRVSDTRSDALSMLALHPAYPPPN